MGTKQSHFQKSELTPDVELSLLLDLDKGANAGLLVSCNANCLLSTVSGAMFNMPGLITVCCGCS